MSSSYNDIEENSFYDNQFRMTQRTVVNDDIVVTEDSDSKLQLLKEKFYQRTLSSPECSSSIVIDLDSDEERSISLDEIAHEVEVVSSESKDISDFNSASLESNASKLLSCDDAMDVLNSQEEASNDLESFVNNQMDISNSDAIKLKIEDSKLLLSRDSEDLVNNQDLATDKLESSLNCETKEILQDLTNLDFLLDHIAFSITSKSEGFTTLAEIHSHIAEVFSVDKLKSDWLNSHIENTLKKNVNLFIRIPRNEESDCWTLHPQAAMNIAMRKTLKANAHEKSNENIFSATTLDLLKNCELETIDSWKGWENPDETNKKLMKRKGHIDKILADVNLRESVLNAKSNVINCENVGPKCAEGPPTLAKKCLKRKSSPLKQIGNDGKRSKSTSVVETKVNDIPRTLSGNNKVKKSAQNINKGKEVPYKSEYNMDQCHLDHKNEKNPENNIKKCKKDKGNMNKGSNKSSVNKVQLKAKHFMNFDQFFGIDDEQQESFLGFDDDFWSGFFRGWEKSVTRKRDKIFEYVKQLEGSMDLVHVLKECEDAVKRYVEELEESNKKNLPEIEDLQHHNVITGDIKQQSKDLLKMIGSTSKEPAFSYTVLIVLALVSTDEPSLSLVDIIEFITENFPYYRSKSLTWAESVKATLIWNDCFIKTCQACRRSPDHGGCWKVEPITASGILVRALEALKNKVEQLEPNKRISTLSKSTSDSHSDELELKKDTKSTLEKMSTSKLNNFSSFKSRLSNKSTDGKSKLKVDTKSFLEKEAESKFNNFNGLKSNKSMTSNESTNDKLEPKEDSGSLLEKSTETNVNNLSSYSNLNNKEIEKVIEQSNHERDNSQDRVSPKIDSQTSLILNKNTLLGSIENSCTSKMKIYINPNPFSNENSDQMFKKITEDLSKTRPVNKIDNERLIEKSNYVRDNSQGKDSLKIHVKTSLILDKNNHLGSTENSCTNKTKIYKSKVSPEKKFKKLTEDLNNTRRVNQLNCKEYSSCEMNSLAQENVDKFTSSNGSIGGLVKIEADTTIPNKKYNKHNHKSNTTLDISSDNKHCSVESGSLSKYCPGCINNSDLVDSDVEIINDIQESSEKSYSNEKKILDVKITSNTINYCKHKPLKEVSIPFYKKKVIESEISSDNCTDNCDASDYAVIENDDKFLLSEISGNSENNDSKEDEIVVVDDVECCASSTIQSKSLVKNGHAPKPVIISNEDNYLCTNCEKRFYCPFVLEFHKCTIKKLNNKYPCYRCHEVLSNAQALSEHMKNEHQCKINKHLKSSICQIFKSNKNTNTSDNVKGNSFACSICFSVFPSLLNLEYHSKSCHEFRCNFCNGSMIFSSKEQLKLHVDLEHCKNRFVCQLCKSVFFDRVLLKHHLAFMHNMRENTNK